MANYTLSQIWIYPVKSLGGIQLTEAFAEEKGLKYDRRWMIVDENNRFLSQRELPEMALIKVDIGFEENQIVNLQFSHKLRENVKYTFNNACFSNEKNQEIEVEIWDDKVRAFKVNEPVNEWLTQLLGVTCSLVFMPNFSQRLVDPKYAITGHEVTSFSDAYPFLIIGNESLKLLNGMLEKPISINRFRPNFVFEGGVAHDEDLWGEFHIGQVQFFGVKKCARCPIPTIDQDSAQMGKEPLKTLSKYRFQNNKVYFGQNLLVGKTGLVKVGDVINVL